MIGRLPAAVGSQSQPARRRQVSGGQSCTDAHTRASGAPVKHALGCFRLWIYSRGKRGKREEKMADFEGEA